MDQISLEGLGKRTQKFAKVPLFKVIKKVAKAVGKVIKKAIELAKKTLKAIGEGLIAAVKAVADVVVAVKFAVNALKYSIKMIIEVGMALLKGDFVGVLKAIFTNALKAAGADPKKVDDFIARAGSAIDNIFKSLFGLSEPY